MLRILRTEFYMRRAKNLLNTVKKHCRTCTIYRGLTLSQIMAALSTPNTVFTHPFTSIGVDFAELFDIRNYTCRACLITKGFFSLFICFATKAIYLEAVSNLSTSAFLVALARFISRRGYATDMDSDNDTNCMSVEDLKEEIPGFS